MQEFVQNFHFLRPLILLLLLVPFILYKCCYKQLNTTSSWEKVCDKRLLDFLLIKGSSTQRKIVFYICGIALLSAILAAAGPSWKKQEAESLVPENPIMILLNLSSDMVQTDVVPNRLSRAKYAITDILSATKVTQKGLIVYTSEPFLISPITEDAKLMINLLPNIGLDIMPENGDRLDRAIDLAVQSLADGQWSKGQIIIVAADIGQDFALALAAAQNAASKGYQINVLDVSAQSNDKLKKLAEQGDGIYATIMQINQLIEKINEQETARLKSSSNKISQWLDEGYWLSFVTLLSCLFLFRRGILVVLFFLASFTEASAGFFLNNNQEGLKAFQKGSYELASKKFEDSSWQGVSSYRLGQYDKAYQQFAQKKDIENLYNQGNALAKMGKLEEAIKKYEEVLQQNSEHEDARFNLEYLKQQQQNQQQSSPEENKQDEDKQDQSSQQSTSAEQSEQSQNEDKPQDSQTDNEQNTDQKKSPEPSSSDEQQQKDDKDKSTNKQQQSKAGQEQKDQPQSKNEENEGSALQKTQDDHTYNEEVQARELQYREIPEDAGGLLRAFIAREYAKNRYAKDKK